METSRLFRVVATVLTAGFLAAGSTGWGATVVWTGAAADGQWTTAGNWDTGTVPTAEDDVAIEDAQVTFSGTTAEFAELEMEENARLDWVQGELQGQRMTVGAGCLLYVRGAGGTRALPTVTNQGTIQVCTGIDLSLGAGASLAAGSELALDVGATLTFAGGSFGLATGSSVTAGDGSAITFSGGTYSFEAGTVFPGTVPTRITGTIYAYGTLDVAGLELVAGGTLDGGTLALAGTLVWSGGDMTHYAGRTVTILPGATLQLVGDGQKGLFSTTLSNEGTISWTGAGGIYYDSSTIHNLPTGLVSLDSDAQLSSHVAWMWMGYVNNEGVLRKTAGTGPQSLCGGITNSGTIDVQSGTLSLDAAYFTHTGTGRIQVGPNAGVILHAADLQTGSVVDLGDAASLLFGDGSATCRTGSSITASGTGAGIQFAGNTTTFETGVRFPTNTTTQVTGGAAFHGDANMPNLELVPGGSLSGTFTLGEGMAWSGGSLSSAIVTVGPGALVDVTGDAQKEMAWSSLTNAGTILWHGAGTWHAVGSALTNAAGAMFELDSDATFDGSVGWYQTPWTNAGTIRKAAGSGLQNLSVGIDNSGTIDVDSGALRIYSLTNRNTVRVGDGTELTLTYADLQGGSTVALVGDASLVFAGGSGVFGAGAGVTASGTGGTIQFASGSFTFEAGAVFPATTTNRVTGGISCSGPVAVPWLELVPGGSLGGTFTLASDLVWSGGSISSAAVTVAQDATVWIVGDAQKNLDWSTLTNYGTIRWSGGGTWSSAGSLIANESTGLIDLESDAPFGTNPGWYPTAVHNAGTLRKSGGTGTQSLPSVVTNTGWLQVLSGALSVYSLANTGRVQVADGSQLTLGGADLGAGSRVEIAGSADLVCAGGTFIFRNGSQVAGGDRGGAVNFAAGDFTVEDGAEFAEAMAYTVTGGTSWHGNVAIPGLELMAGGNMGSTFTLAGDLTWSGGSLSSAAVSIAPAATVSIVGDSQKYMDWSTLTNNGTILWSGNGPWSSMGSAFENAATGLLDLQSDTTFSTNPGWHPTPIRNAGLLRKSAGAGTHSLTGPVQNTGTIESQSGGLYIWGLTQTAGQTWLNGGNLTLGTEAQFSGGVLRGAGTFQGSLAVYRSVLVAPGASAGELVVTGTYTQNLDSTLQIEVGGPVPGAGFDRLTVNGTATLAGALQVRLLNGYQPAADATFAFLSCGARSGTFNSVDGLGITDATAFVLDYGATSATLTVVAGPANTAPKAVADKYKATEDTVLQVGDRGVLKNDSDRERDPLSAVLASIPAHGALALRTDGTFTYTPEADYAGPDSFTYWANDGHANSATVATATITVGAVNDAPSFTAAGNVQRIEDSGPCSIPSWAQSISAGPANESAQKLSFTVTNSNSKLFSGQPAVALDGTLTFTPAANAFGSATVTVTLRDNGGTAGGGRSASAPYAFTIDVPSVNDAPVFVKGPDQAVRRGAGFQAVPRWIKSVTPGPANESGQQVAFGVWNSNSGLFAVGPAIAADGTLTYTPAADATGRATVFVNATDTGGWDYGGQNTSATQAFLITVNRPTVGDAVPQATDDGWGQVLEDQTLTVDSPGVLANDTDTDGDVLQAQLVGRPAHGSVTLSAAGGFVYTPSKDYVGNDTFTYKVTDTKHTSAVATAYIGVASVNDAPGFAKGPDVKLLEDAPAQALVGWAKKPTAGPANEGAQVLAYDVQTDQATLFAVPPAVAANGTLTFTPAANAFGTARVTVVLRDDGGVDNGGVNATAAQTFAITVQAVNDPPSFVKGPDLRVDRNAPAQTVPGWATQVSVGPDNESAQKPTFSITGNTNTRLFSKAPAIAADGALTFTPAANAEGTATLTVSVRDSGGRTNGGNDASAAQTFSITVRSANDVPSFVAGLAPTVREDAGPQQLPGWATTIDDGDGDAIQALDFVVAVTSGAALFAVPPAVSPEGTLSFTPAADAFGQATVTVRLHDDGGTANGGTDTSAAQTVQITVLPVNDAPALTIGADVLVAPDSGLYEAAGWAALGAGPANEADQRLDSVVDSDQPGLFDIPPTVLADGTLLFLPAAGAEGMATVTVAAHDSGGTGNGGTDTSPVQTFTVTLATVIGTEQTATLPGNRVFRFDTGVYDGGLPSEIMYDDLSGTLILPHGQALTPTQPYAGIHRAPLGIYEDSNGTAAPLFTATAGTVYVFRSLSFDPNVASTYYKLEIVSSSLRPSRTDYGSVTFRYRQIMPPLHVDAEGEWSWGEDGAYHLSVMGETMLDLTIPATASMYVISGDFVAYDTFTGVYTTWPDGVGRQGNVTLVLTLGADGLLQLDVASEDDPALNLSLTGGTPPGGRQR